MKINPTTRVSCSSSSKASSSRSPRVLHASLAVICFTSVLWLWTLVSLIDQTHPQSIEHAWKLVKDKALSSQNRLFVLRGSSKTEAPAAQDASRSNDINHHLVLPEYDCVGWRQTGGCSPDGPRELDNDKDCHAFIPNGASGYCELRHRKTNETIRMLQMHCNSLRDKVSFSCALYQDVLAFQQQATEYVHDASFSFEANQRALQQENPLQTPRLDSFERAIVMVVYEKVLPSVYASVLHLRSINCTLPVEMWYRREEVDIHHVILRELVDRHNVLLREITNPHATWFYAKLHAIFYSAFDQVLFLDADNFAVKDPRFLFGLAQFQTTGAMFWPDYWHPGNTIFNVHDESAVWELFDLPFVDEFEQESGQLLINRRQHLKALNTLMFYGFHRPRLYEQLEVLWGDKDLYRLAWRKTNSSFYSVPFAPGSAGSKGHTMDGQDWFCGATIVQHDVNHEVLFLHRNSAKFYSASSSDNPKSVRVWSHIQQFRGPPADFRKFRVGGSSAGPLYPAIRACFGKDVNYTAEFTVKPMEAFGLEELEDKLFRFVEDANEVLKTR